MNQGNTSVLRTILGSPFYFHTNSVDLYLPLLAQFLQGESPKKPELSGEMHKYFAAMGEPYGDGIEQEYDNYPVKVGNKLVIPIMGAVLQYDYCWQAGMTTIAQWYMQGLNDPTIDGFIELTNSPGGSVFGTGELAQTKLKVRQEKPIITVCEGMICSAAFFAGCASNLIMATSNMCVVGCIGSMTTYRDWSEYYAKIGLKITDVYPSTSNLKNKDIRDAKTGDFTAMETGTLFSMDRNFMDFVKSQRPSVTQLALDGADMTADDGMKNGLVDAIGSIEDAFGKLDELIFANNKTQNKQMATNPFKALLAHFGKPGSEEETQDTAELHSCIANQKNELNSLKAELQTEKDAHKATKDALTALMAERDSLKEQVRIQDLPSSSAAINAPEMEIMASSDDEKTWDEYCNEDPFTAKAVKTLGKSVLKKK